MNNNEKCFVKALIYIFIVALVFIKNICINHYDTDLLILIAFGGILSVKSLLEIKGEDNVS